LQSVNFQAIARTILHNYNARYRLIDIACKLRDLQSYLDFD